MTLQVVRVCLAQTWVVCGLHPSPAQQWPAIPGRPHSWPPHEEWSGCTGRSILLLEQVEPMISACTLPMGSSKPYVLLGGETGLACSATVLGPTWAAQSHQTVAPVLMAPLCFQAPYRVSSCFLLLSVQISWARPTSVSPFSWNATVQSRVQVVNKVDVADHSTLKMIKTSTDKTFLLDIKGLLSIHFLMRSFQLKLELSFLLHTALATPEDKGEPRLFWSVTSPPASFPVLSPPLQSLYPEVPF